MDITWLAHGCFRLRGRYASVVTDPYPPALGPKLPKLEAELVTVSHHHDNHSYVQTVVKQPYVIDGPGEYEVAGISVTGVPSFHDSERGARRGRNTVYVIEIDEVRVCHLGDLGHRLDDSTIEILGNLDVALVPVGGGGALDATQAADVVRQLEPRFVIPMHYAIPEIRKELEPVERFLREMGVAEEPQPKLSLQASSAETDTKVVVLEPRV